MRLIIFTLLAALVLAAPAMAKRKIVIISSNDGQKMSLIPEGKFYMGSSDDDIREMSPVHEVYLDAFYMDVTEISNDQFAEFLNDLSPEEGVGGKRWGWVVLRNDTETDERFSWWPTEIVQEGGEYLALEGHEGNPVITVNWYAADEYCKWAGKRLPTEAEWEKAARGGFKGKRFPWGDEIPTDALIFERYWRNNQDAVPTGRVGNYFPNGYGIYDMAGNVWEWVSDWYNRSYYGKSPRVNPQGPTSGEKKIIRGGGWNTSAMGLRLAIRVTDLPASTNDGVGFRCAKNVEDAP